jgi:acetyl-CoA C-acetyltransferase
VERADLDPTAIDDVVFAQSYANSEAPCIGRWIALEAGFPETVSGIQVDRRWGARAGNAQLYDRLDRGRERSQPEWRYGRISSLIETAENLAREYEINREEADAFAMRSHQRAHSAWEEGRFDAEIVPVEVPQRKGDPILFARDEGIRPDTRLEKLADLRPIMGDGFQVTAGNASQQNDAAAACLVVAEDRLEALGLRPMAFLEGWAAAGCDPAIMGIGPVPSTARVFDCTGLSFEDIHLIEINEAFAAQVLAVLKAWGLSPDDPRLNPNGSGISLGHPIGATGMRMVVTLLHELERRKGRRGLATMCIGGGQGMAAVLDRAR